MTTENDWGGKPRLWKKLMYSFIKWPLGPKSLHGGHVSANSLEKLFGCNVPIVGMSGGLITGPQPNIVGMIVMNI
jgi:hypothetical protein